MNEYSNISNELRNDSSYKWLGVIRIMLGLVLFLRGIQFIADRASLMHILSNSQFEFLGAALIHFVIFAHIGGGIMIIIGAATKVAILIQLPILIGAVFFINAKSGLFSANNPELLFSAIILVLMLFFLRFGSGGYSIDNAKKSTKKT